MSGQIKTAGGLYEPEELASAYNEQRDLIAELKREKQRLEVSLGRSGPVTMAERYDALVQALRPFVDDSGSELDCRVGALEDSLQESDFDELSAKVDDMVDAMRRAAEALSDI